ncbi:hypothetical protein RDI58_008659 [Solanum bulbocastanum]|uniref:Uncharacterized protein n=1 Tax=Solanum bulbocastanum TaxID=147425 RepID=A0AAN8YKC1_SOLBU
MNRNVQQSPLSDKDQEEKARKIEGQFLCFPFSASILTPPLLLTIGHLHLLSPLLFSFIAMSSTATHLKFGRPSNAAIFAPRFFSPLRLFSILHFAWSLQLLPISRTVEISVMQIFLL